MEAKSKTQKTCLKSLAVIAGSLILSLNLSAQDLWPSSNMNVSANEIALAAINNSNESKAASNNSKALTESEKTMTLEKWMTNEGFFNAEANHTEKKIIKSATFVFEEITDSKLEFEDWMFNPEFWKVKK